MTLYELYQTLGTYIKNDRNKIATIKAVREFTGASLKAAKDVVDDPYSDFSANLVQSVEKRVLFKEEKLEHELGTVTEERNRAEGENLRLLTMLVDVQGKLLNSVPSAEA